MQSNNQDVNMPDATQATDDMNVEVGVKRDLTGDEGVFKEIIKLGSGSETPQKGDQVFVHYVGTLESDNSEFDSSRSRGEPFKFELGKGNVIKGWDVAVATMKKGEVSKVTIRSDYGYGDSGSPPKIPGGATLVFEIELLEWKSVKDIAGDGGVIKESIITEGEGWAKPKDDDEVTVKLSARVQGKESDAPFFSSDAVEFTVKDGFLCKAIATAVKTMKKKEQVKLVVKPSYGFGEEGKESDGIPPNATLDIDMTLLSWKKVEKITDDGAIIKKVLVESQDWQRPNSGAQVTVAFTGRLADGTVFDERKKENPLEFVIDEEQAPCEGFEKALVTMKKGEHALVTISPHYAFGTDVDTVQPKATVPVGSTVVYDIELIDFVKGKESWDMDVDEKINAASTAKDKGNAAFKANKIERAIHLWEKAKQFIEYDDQFEIDKKKVAKDLKKSIELNLAAAHLKAGRPGEAKKAADKVLESDSFHLKGLYRRAQAFIETGDWVEAAQDIKKALGVEPNNVDFKVLLKKLKVAEAKAAQSEKALWAGSFQKMMAKNATAMKSGDENGVVTDGGVNATATEQ